MFGGGGSIQLARVFGIRIGASPSWFFVLFVVIWLLSGYFDDALAASETAVYAVAVGGALLLFLSILLHELGHAFAARRLGIGIAGIDLWFFGGVAKMSRDTATPGEELKVAAAGPAVTLLLAVAAFAGAVALSDTDGVRDAVQFRDTVIEPGPALLTWLGEVNVALFVFNLIPAFPLDGGRIARATAWKLTGDKNRATRASARVGQLFSYVLIGLGIFLAFDGDAASGIWLAVLGWFLGQAARGAVVASEFSERIEGVTAADLMDADAVAVPAGATALTAQDDFFLRYREPWFPVTDDEGRVVGRVTDTAVEAAVSDGQPAFPVAKLLAAPEDEDRVRDDTPLEHLLASEPLRALGALMVVDAEGRLVGMVTVDRVRRALAAGVARPVV